jgi:sterol desaturase/sphingolipid hydroxylase (fatty acid hydroxylase superfamily)
MYGVPMFSKKPNRGPNHMLLVTFNLLIASLFAFFTTEWSVTNRNLMKFNDVFQYGLISILLEVFLAITYQSMVEYYWHRMMHLKSFYIIFHKYHHFYKSPEPWDDMYIHPIEAVGYYCILYGPPFLFPIHCVSFILYMIVMGLCGVLDHSGIHFSIPGLYNTVDHDNHHAKFEVNYSFPFPFMDMLHGTFEGEFLGREFRRSNNKRS